ncbi:MAG: type VI secretion system-associated FHA domain protein TagH [Pseudomonadota bacterium]|nr:type VI secretion system-associated FHA domain protein TagH [Pseudomonadota bacterium]
MSAQGAARQHRQVTLTVVSSNKDLLGANSAWTFGVKGGSIGRARSNAWHLPDPLRYVSSVHAEVQWQDGEFYLADLSTNGVFFSGAEAPIGKGQRTRLRNGDRLQIGEYEIEVGLDSAAGVFDELDDLLGSASDSDRLEKSLSDPPTSNSSFTPSVSATPDDQIIPVDPLAAMGGQLAPAGHADRPASSDQAADSDLSQWLGDEQPPAAESDGVSARNASADALNVPFSPPGLIPEDWDATGDHAPLPNEIPHGAEESLRENSPVPAVEPTVASESPQPTSSDDKAVRALLAGLGLDELDLTEAQKVEFCYTVGQAVRETVTGLIDGLRIRNQARADFRMSVTQVDREGNNPLKFSVSADEAMRKMFGERHPGYLPPIDALKQALSDLNGHQDAFVVGMRAALDAVAQEMNPAALESRFKSRSGGGVLSVAWKGRYWDWLMEHYRMFSDDDGRAYRQLYEEHFIDAYERRIEQTRQGG